MSKVPTYQHNIMQQVPSVSTVLYRPCESFVLHLFSLSTCLAITSRTLKFKLYIRYQCYYVYHYYQLDHCWNHMSMRKILNFTLIKMVSNRINDIFSLYYNISLILEFRPGMRGILIISSTRVLRSTRYKQYLNLSYENV